jgi:hypothetical protein
MSETPSEGQPSSGPLPSGNDPAQQQNPYPQFPPAAPPPYPGQPPGGYPVQQPEGYPGQAPGVYPGYPGQQPGAYPGQQPGGYPGQPPGAYPGQQPGGYPGQPPGSWPPGFTPPRRSRTGWWIGGAAVVVIALVAAGIFAVLHFVGAASGGAASPQAAVLNFLAAAQNDDAFAAADLLDPEEQSGVKQVLDKAQNSAQNAGYQQGGGKNGLLEGLRISTDNVQTSVTTIRDDLTRVTFTGGKITLAFDPDRANPGVKDLFTGDQSHQRTWTASDLQTRSNSGATVQPEAMTVRRSGRWYVSLLYTFLDMSAQKQGKAPVDPGKVGTQNYPSPEAAAQGFVNGLVSTLTSADIGPVAQTLSSDEGALLATYRQLFTKLRPQSVQVVGTPEFSATNTGDNTASVKVKDLRLQITDQDGNTRKIAIHGNCLIVRHRTKCDFSGANPGQGLVFSPASTGFIATKGQNGWHIDPVATYLDTIATTLHDASKDQVAALLAGFNVPKAFLRINSQGQLSTNEPKSITLTRSGNQGPAVAVFDLPVNGGQTLAIDVESRSSDGSDDDTDAISWVIVGKSGAIAKGDGGTSGDEFTPPDTETAKFAVWGATDESVTVTIHS